MMKYKALLLLVCFCQITTPAASSLEQGILRLQSELATTPSSETESTMEKAVQNQVDRLKAQFRETPRPADRQDHTKAVAKRGTFLWFLMEIPQWWVTAKVLKVLDEDSERLLVHQTAAGEDVEVTRGKQVRVVAPEDQTAWGSEYYRDLGELSRVEGEQDQRHEYYEQALHVDPTNPHAMDNLGLYYMDRGDYQQSKQWFRKSIQANPNWYHSYYNLGLLQRDNPQQSDNNARETLQSFETAFQLNPLFLDSLWNVAELYSKLDQRDQECYHWRLLRVLNRNPSPDERDFGIWNPHWEDFTTQRIEQCMEVLKMQQRGSETSDGEL